MVPIPDDMINHDIVYEVDTDHDGEAGDDVIPLPCVQDQFLQMMMYLETKINFYLTWMELLYVSLDLSYFMKLVLEG